MVGKVMTKSINRVRVRVSDVVEAVVEVSKLRHADLFGRRRFAAITYWRKVGYIAAYSITGQSLSAIAQHWDKDHTTLVYTMKRWRTRDANDQRLHTDLMRVAERAIEIAESRGLLRRAA